MTDVACAAAAQAEATGAWADALVMADEALAETMARGLLYYLPTVHLLRGQALLHLNCTADAKDALNRALQMAEEFDLALISWRALVGLAEYHDREGDQEDAKTFYRQAAALVQTISASYLIRRSSQASSVGQKLGP